MSCAFSVRLFVSTPPASTVSAWRISLRLFVGESPAAENPVTARTIRYLPFFQREEVSHKLLRCRLFYGSLSVARNSSKDTHPLVAFGWQVLASVLSQISMA